MLKLVASALLLSSLTVSAGSLPAGSADPIPAIEASFLQSSSVSFYFVSRTGNYTLSDKELMKSATVRVVRECGNNCASFMREVIAHLRTARKVSCSAGQEDVLIVPNRGSSLMFSRSGRVLRYGTECFFTTTGIGSVLKKDRFFFN